MDPVRLDDIPLGRLVHVAGRLVGQRWSAHLAERHGLTPAGMQVLFALARHGEAGHREIAERCFVRPATLTGIVDTLERGGLVTRRRDPADRRTVRLALTESGDRQVRELFEMVHRRDPLTSVDADPANAAVIRRFLLELIATMSDGEDNGLSQADHQRAPGGGRC
ncbi:MarR family winged helix-turn-helix transcriptional regulator [Plantactinospora sp. KBS50]|uniref:MarR family winged helix-turn-helix transcriptional regulator n=1 Tax=Plantactinospora sp. KBS50 TaxID=2024580 RepID=UPI000BAAC08E|nr:MarR family winged helix-turn-helix transcriptional regulator [Plantactinospora sp. KBS50]ASW56706.1 MarR family transcriptional regulator [Plantactinospora sp. KBS50]